MPQVWWAGILEAEEIGDGKVPDERITEYWRKHYATEHCTLCGNHGVIDSRTIRTSAGKHVGRLNYCICPNGQTLREQNGDLEWWLTN